MPALTGVSLRIITKSAWILTELLIYTKGNIWKQMAKINIYRSANRKRNRRSERKTDEGALRTRAGRGKEKEWRTQGLTDYFYSSPEVINNQSSLVHVLFRVTCKMQDSPLFIQLALCCQITARWLWPRAIEHFASLLQDCKLYILILDQQALK